MAGITRGFFGRGKAERDPRLPPGQYVERGWPVLTAGPTPQVDPDDWTFRIDGMVANEKECKEGPGIREGSCQIGMDLRFLSVGRQIW